MSKRSSPGPSRRKADGKTWCWRKWIDPATSEGWMGELTRSGYSSFALTENPARVRCLLAVYFKTCAEALCLVRKWGGQTRSISSKDWWARGPASVLKIGSDLQIHHEKPPGGKKGNVARLHIPHGLAFGSGDHATTFMLLRALVKRPRLEETRVLDLGTGSGVLALAARLFGANKIIATDWDADAVRTARDNEKLNFREPLIHWRKADVKRLRAQGHYNLVLANLFSGILCEAAGPITASLAAGGELWLSGILRTQQDEVARVYRGLGLQLIRTVRRGKWVMLQWRRRNSSQATGGELKKIVQTK